MFGNKSWEDLLLELHYQLGLYSEGARSAPIEEKEAMRVVQHGIIRRLAETSLRMWAAPHEASLKTLLAGCGESQKFGFVT